MIAWTRFLLTLAYWYDWLAEKAKTTIRNIQTLIFYRLLHIYLPRSMLLLRNGQWVDVGPGFPIEQVVWIYDAKQHLLSRPTETGFGRGERWPWLGAIDSHGRDLSDFFASLRISRGPTPAAMIMLALFACQKGWMPEGEIGITRRDGEEMVINATTGSIVAASEAAASEPRRSLGIGPVTVAHIDHIQ
jgi:hypothetical protein